MAISMIDIVPTIKVLFAAAEAEPFAKLGGLGDVAGALPKALLDVNAINEDLPAIDIRLFLPFHKVIKETFDITDLEAEFLVRNSNGDFHGKCYSLKYNKLKVYFVDGEPIQKANHVYDTNDEINKNLYTFFSIAIIEAIKNIEWKPDILHANDWHAAIAVYKLLKEKSDPKLKDIASILTIHNLPYMGSNIEQILKSYNLSPSLHNILPDWSKFLPLPLGIISADQTTTVSPTYAEEIKTQTFGCGLESVFNSLNYDITGILNGVDQDIWDPITDHFIDYKYDIKTLENKFKNKDALLSEYSLKKDPSIPLLVTVSRLDYQKGIDMLIDAIHMLAKEHEFNLIILGSGDTRLEDKCFQLENEHPDYIKFINTYSAPLSHKLYASGDIFLMPSRYEPCGISQMISMKYGCVPIGHATGGLKDTIIDVEENYLTNGFLFHETYEMSTYTIRLQKQLRFIQTILESWLKLQKNGMNADFSWQNSARTIYYMLIQTITI